jgi:hypothetical protein
MGRRVKFGSLGILLRQQMVRVWVVNVLGRVPMHSGTGDVCYTVASRRPRLCCFCSCWEQISIMPILL